MANPNGLKGYRWERAVAQCLAAVGFKVRRTGKSRESEGDIEGIPDWVIECKDQTDRRLDAWLDQAKRSAIRTGKPYYCVVQKSRGHSAEEAYVYMRLETFVKFLAESRLVADSTRESDSSAGTEDEGTVALRMVQSYVPDSEVA